MKLQTRAFARPLWRPGGQEASLDGVQSLPAAHFRQIQTTNEQIFGAGLAHPQQTFDETLT